MTDNIKAYLSKSTAAAGSSLPGFFSDAARLRFLSREPVSAGFAELR